MAVLTDDEKREVWRLAYRNGRKVDIKASGLTLNRTSVGDGIQAMEDAALAWFPTLKSAVETATGDTLTNAGVIALFDAYATWAASKRLGG